MKLLLKLKFLGTNFCGYQVQPGMRTVQQTLNEATRELFGFECDIVGCSRTDSGVHANEFCVTVAQKGTGRLESPLPCEKILPALNAHLPEDIAVIETVEVPQSFHARYDVKWKEYLYRIYDSPVRDPFEIGRAYFLGRRLTRESIEQMNRGAGYFCGEHDFSSYMASGSKITDAVRNVKYAEVRREGNCVVFFICANGFLYHMVRIMAGTLLMIAQGKMTAEEIPVITEKRDRSAAGMTAPACGLYLNHVYY